MTTARLASQAMRAMRRYKLRSGLMMIGSFIGIAALTLTMSVGQGVRHKMIRTVHQILGDASVLVIGGGSRMMGSPRPGATRLTIDDMDAVAREVPNIEVWDPQEDGPRQTVRFGDATTTVRVTGQSERWQQAWGRSVSRGESFDATAVSSSARVALIGETVVRKLFAGQDPIDAEIRIGAVPFKVIGVLETFGIDMHGMDRDNEIVVPVTTAMRRLANSDAITAAKIVVKDPSRLGETSRAVGRVLRERHSLVGDQPDDFTIVNSLQMQQIMRTVQRVVMVYLPLVGGVALLVGGVVAATLMLASVTERTSEIGLRRAVGARPEDIRRQFVAETTAVIVAGAAVGILLGYYGARVVAERMRLDGAFSWTAVLVSLAASAVTGFLAGVAPARRAARLNPAEALR
jgi:putative ABC transport system permease protein